MNTTTKQQRADLVRRYRRALARAKRYNGRVHWETVARLADQLVQVRR